MRNTLRFLLIFIASVLPLLGQPYVTESAEQKEIQLKGVIENFDADSRALDVKDVEGRFYIPHMRKARVLVAEARFVDNGDGTVTDTKRKIMWQKGDNGKEVTFEEAEKYCKTLRLGGYTDWRLPNPDEPDTAVVVELMTAIHSRDAYARFDLFWSSDPTILLPFNYRPSHGKEVSRVYPTPKKRARAFVRAIRSVGTAKPDSSS